MKSTVLELRERFVESAGHVSQSFGLGRVPGQIFAYVYFQKEAQSLDDLTGALGISKGSASMGVRQLAHWGALKRVWVKGDRKDYYEATDKFGEIIRKAFLESVGQSMETADSLLADVDREIKQGRKGANLTQEELFVLDRLTALKEFRDRAKFVWNKWVLKLLLKA